VEKFDRAIAHFVTVRAASHDRDPLLLHSTFKLPQATGRPGPKTQKGLLELRSHLNRLYAHRMIVIIREKKISGNIYNCFGGLAKWTSLPL
jgi:hypothetical protein